MTAITVRTQAELDAALNDPNVAYDNTEIFLDAPAGVTLVVDDGRGHRVTAFGSSTVQAFGSSAVTARGSSTVHAFGSSAVTAYGSSAVTAYDSSTVTAYGSSAVTAFGSSEVTSYGSSTVTTRGSSAVTSYGSSAVTSYGSSAVTAYDSSAVTSYGSSTVTSYGSSAVTAYDSSTVTSYDSSTVTATTAGVTITIHTTTDATTPTRWATENGASVSGGEVKLYKALPDDLTSGLLYGRPTVWAVGEEVTCDDWRADDKCGGGLHLSPTPGHAWQHLDYETRPRFLECVAPIDTIIPLHGDVAKCKAPRVRVVREVDMAGHQVTSEEGE